MIHKQWSGETSANVVFFTRELGVVRALCQGGRLPKKQILLQAFTPLWVVFHERSTFYYVKQLELVMPALPLEGINLLAGLYVNELIYQALRPMDACPGLFDAYEEALQQLAKSTEPAFMAQSLRYFEEKLLNEMGYGISLTHEARTGEPILPEKQYTVMVEEGLVQVLQGIPGEYLLAWTNQQWHLPQVRKTAKTVMRLMLDHALGGKTLQTRKLLTS